MNLIPIGDVVLIEKDNVTETPSGIELLESYKDPAGCDSGIVVRLNWQYTNDNGVQCRSQVEANQRVLFLRKHGVAVKGSKTLVAVRQANLLAVYEDE